MDDFVLKRNFSANIAKIVWAIYTVSWHSIGNVNHFKEITSLKQTNLQVVSLNFFFLYKFNVGLFLLHKLSPTAISLTGTVPV